MEVIVTKIRWKGEVDQVVEAVAIRLGEEAKRRRGEEDKGKKEGVSLFVSKLKKHDMKWGTDWIH